MPAFIVKIINKDLDKTKDDVLTIKNNDHGFTWSYKHSQVPYSDEVNLDSPDSVYYRLETLLDMVYRDTQPPEFIQLEAPGFPTIIFRHGDLKKAHYTVLDALDLTLKAWPRAKFPPAPAPPKTPRKHLFFDDC